MAFLTPLALLGALFAIPIILLYMLRLRRREVVISSTFLWQQVLRDSEANTPWQRLRRNLLLFLQLVILALLVLALMRPFITVPAVSAGQIELLLDASASMNALDGPGGLSRFEQARREALAIVDTMGTGDTMTIIRVADVPEVLAPSTGDKALLRAAINNAQPSQAAADWEAALTLAAADAARAERFSLVLVSDGGLGAASGLTGVPGDIRYVPVGQSADNLAISALSTRSLPGQPTQLFAQITNTSDQDAEIIFDLRVDGELISAERYAVPAQSQIAVVSNDLPAGFQTVRAGLTRAADSPFVDVLPLDDAAYALSTERAARRILLLTEGNLFLEQALRSLPGVEAFRGDITQALPTEPFDLTILDGWLPPGTTLPDGDLFIIDPPRSTTLFDLGPTSEATGNIQVRREDPRMIFVDFADVNVLRFATLADIDWADPLITADGGPLLLAGERAGRQTAILTFDVRDSDLPLRIAWPVLLANLLEWFTPRALISQPDGLRVGDSLSVRPPFEADEVRVTLPDGVVRSLAITRDTVVFADTDQAGIYSLAVLGGGQLLQESAFAVNLFAPEESRIAPQPEISLSGAAIAPAMREEVGQQEFWPLVAALALLVLMIEWIVYQRRIQARTLFRPLRPLRSV